MHFECPAQTDEVLQEVPIETSKPIENNTSEFNNNRTSVPVSDIPTITLSR